MALATFSDRYAGGNLGTTVTVSSTVSFIPTVLGISASGTGTLLRVQFQLTAPAAAAGPSATDQFYLGPLLIGYTLNGYFIDVPDMDSSTGMTAELGDSATAGRYIATGTTFAQAQGFFLSGGTSQVAASLPHFYSTYSTQRSETGSNRSIGVADDLIITFTHAATTYVPSTVIRGFYDLTCAEYPLGTVTTNY